jgi:adenine C2-methylase RlmN of 23S rRNA A2503 and tRNA A37
MHQEGDEYTMINDINDGSDFKTELITLMENNPRLREYLKYKFNELRLQGLADD